MMDEDATQAAWAQQLLEAQAQGDAQKESVGIAGLYADKRRNASNHRHPNGMLGVFFDRVAFGGLDCWYWVGTRGDIGYGIFGSAGNYGMSEIMAHRISWLLFNGEIPDGLNVLHRCDVRACVNPDHLFLGSQADNVQDMCAKGRNVNVPLPGESNGGAKLSDEKVIEMRARYAAGGISFKDLANEFNVSTMTAYRAVVRQSWSHI